LRTLNALRTLRALRALRALFAFAGRERHAQHTREQYHPDFHRFILPL
jgi:hypothetical protein